MSEHPEKMALLQLRIPAEQKAAWVRASREQSPDPEHPQKLRDWVTEHLDLAAEQRSLLDLCRLQHAALVQAKNLLAERYAFESAAALVDVIREAERRLR